MFEHLPGGDILRDGLRDLRMGEWSVPALLVLTAEYRLSRCGIAIPAVARPPIFEHEVYRLLAEEHGPEVYRHYRAWSHRSRARGQSPCEVTRGESNLGP